MINRYIEIYDHIRSKTTSGIEQKYNFKNAIDLVINNCEGNWFNNSFDNPLSMADEMVLEIRYLTMMNSRTNLV